MSGGGGGGGNNQQQAPTPAGTPMQTIQPGMPGQISTLADQLAAGFGQKPADMLAQLQQYYQPMSIPNYAPLKPTPTPAPTPAPGGGIKAIKQQQQPYNNNRRYGADR